MSLPDFPPSPTHAQAEAFGLHLSLFPWQWYVTLTFRGNPSETSANHALWAFIRAVRKSQGFMPGFIAVTEYQRRGVVHFHLLALNVSGLLRLEFKDWWERYGHARVMPYDPMRGANWYVGKYLFKSNGQVQMSRNLAHWLPDPASPTVQAIGRVFDVGAGEQLANGKSKAGPQGSRVPVAVGVASGGVRGNSEVA